MPKTTYTATDPNGKVHARKTDRVYTHTVIFQASKDSAIERANERRGWDLKSAREQFANAASSIEQLKAGFIAKRCEILARDDKYATECQTKGKAFVAQWNTPEAFADAKLAEALAQIEATDWNEWHNAGWCGRFDLAHKLACKYPFGRAAILEAQAKA